MSQFGTAGIATSFQPTGAGGWRRSSRWVGVIPQGRTRLPRQARGWCVASSSGDRHPDQAILPVVLTRGHRIGMHNLWHIVGKATTEGAIWRISLEDKSKYVMDGGVNNYRFRYIRNLSIYTCYNDGGGTNTFRVEYGRYFAITRHNVVDHVSFVFGWYAAVSIL